MDFNVNFNRIDIANKEFMTSGAVNIFEAHFEFDESWNGFARTAVFRSGDYGAAVAVVLDATDTCKVPWESLIAEAPLWVGVVGVSGDKKLPTNYVNAGCVAEGAEGGDFAPPPTPSEIEQILAQIGDLRELKTKSKGTLVDAINETYDRAGTGGVDIDPTLSVEGAAADAAAVGSVAKQLADRDVDNVYYFWNSSHTNDVVGAYNRGAPAVIAGSFDEGCPDGLKDAEPPCWVVFGNQSYGKVDMNITDARGMVWAGSLDLRDYSIFAVPVTQTLNLTGVKKGQIPRIARVSKGETVVPTAWEAADLPEADNSLGLSSATVGQTIKVKAVDVDGKPTAWEAVDMAGGGSKPYKILYNQILSEAAVVKVDANADAAACNEYVLSMAIPKGDVDANYNAGTIMLCTVNCVNNMPVVDASYGTLHQAHLQKSEDGGAWLDFYDVQTSSATPSLDTTPRTIWGNRARLRTTDLSAILYDSKIELPAGTIIIIGGR